MPKEKILVIKHGSLGDWVLATGAFKLIRAHHPRAHITLLTQQSYAELGRQCAWFDEVMIDNRKPWYHFVSNVRLIKKLRGQKYNHIYDLQCSSRTGLYHSWLKSSVCSWHGNAKGCSHYVEHQPKMHAIEWLATIIKTGGIKAVPKPDISWLKTKAAAKLIKQLGKFVLFVPGSSAKHKAKRWTAAGYAEVIDWLAGKNIQSVLTGAGDDEKIIRQIVVMCESQPLNLLNASPLDVMAELARHAIVAIGSDTGPMHVVAAAGAPSLVLFSGASCPEKSRPWGGHVMVLREHSLAQLQSSVVIEALKHCL